MTLKGKNKVCSLCKKSRMELGSALMTLKGKNKLCRLQRKEQNGAGMRNNDPKE